MKLLFVFLISGICLASCTDSSQDSEVKVVTNSQEEAAAPQEVIAQDVDVATFAKLIHDEPGQIVDVRTPEEWNDGMIASAMPINFYAPDFAQQIQELDKSKPVYVYCAAGGRSGKAKQIMQKQGFKKVYNLVGGMGAWQMAQQPVQKPQ